MGKTGLCLSLLEEAAIDRIPVIAIDPKGDLGNLLLTFPNLKPAEFRPWVDENEALRKGLSPEQFAEKTAELWKSGLADWDQSAERIKMFRDAADLAIYTPGSDAGIPLSVIQSFSAPPETVLRDADAFRDRIMASTSSLLDLLKIDSDPIRSREHILLSNILAHAWQQHRHLSIAEIIREIQQPPFEKVGFMDLETFFPEKDRFKFSLLINNLLASPGFAAWMKGEPLNIERLLVTPGGQPRVSILSIAHLSDAERMFFVTILLNELLTWVRSQPGTSTLRAILYMDEVFGYLPPTANPPSKLPLLTLLKQARAFGVGVVLATQNPVDLDYKGLSNTGTWFLGRLQTERDKARVLDGLESVSGESGAAFDRNQMGKMLSELGQRKFLLHNVHENRPIVFQTRWALSYLRGPLTRQQIQTLMENRKSQEAPMAPPVVEGQRKQQEQLADSAEQKSVQPPVLSSSIIQRYLAMSQPLPTGSKLVYYPALLGAAKIHYIESKAEIDRWQELGLLVVDYEEGTIDPWEEAELYPSEQIDFDSKAVTQANYQQLPADLTRSTKYRTWKKLLKEYLYRDAPLTIWKCAKPVLYGQAYETEAGFRLRVAQSMREANDLKIEKLKARYASRFSTARERVGKAEERVNRERKQLKQESYQSVISVGSSILGALLGRKLVSKTNLSKASSAMRKTGKVSKERADLALAEEKLKNEEKKLLELENQFDVDVEGLADPIDPQQIKIRQMNISPRKSDLIVSDVSLLWMPYAEQGPGALSPLFHLDQ